LGKDLAKQINHEWVEKLGRERFFTDALKREKKANSNVNLRCPTFPGRWAKQIEFPNPSKQEGRKIQKAFGSPSCYPGLTRGGHAVDLREGLKDLPEKKKEKGKAYSGVIPLHSRQGRKKHDHWN